MNAELPESQANLPSGIINLRDRCPPSSIMDVRARKVVSSTPVVEKRYLIEKKIEYQRSLSQGSSGGRKLLASYFSLESLLLLICLTASLLILPLILPPLPPPPFMLLLIPIGILVLLMVLAFMPSNARDVTYTYV